MGTQQKKNYKHRHNVSVQYTYKGSSIQTRSVQTHTHTYTQNTHTHTHTGRARERYLGAVWDAILCVHWSRARKVRPLKLWHNLGSLTLLPTHTLTPHTHTHTHTHLAFLSHLRVYVCVSVCMVGVQEDEWTAGREEGGSGGREEEEIRWKKKDGVKERERRWGWRQCSADTKEN